MRVDIAGGTPLGWSGPRDGAGRRRPDGDRPPLRRPPGQRTRAIRRRVSLDALENRRDPLSAADAQRREAVSLLALAELVRQGEREPRARRTQRMSERARAAVHVRLLAVEAEVLLHREVLRRERFVDLDEVHVLDLEPGSLKRLTRRWRGADPHDVGVHAADA